MVTVTAAAAATAMAAVVVPVGWPPRRRPQGLAATAAAGGLHRPAGEWPPGSRHDVRRQCDWSALGELSRWPWAPASVRVVGDGRREAVVMNSMNGFLQRAAVLETPPTVLDADCTH